MKRYVIDDLVEEILACVRRHNFGGPGEYSRWSIAKDMDYGLNEYGCADAANILYTVGHFSKDAEVRQAEAKVLQSLQDPETGLFSEATHHPIHTTAHCTAALELYDTAPLYPCHALRKYTQKDALYHLLEKEINWAETPWRDSHLGAGILPCLDNAGMIGLTWKEWYFDWMWEHTDPENGFIFGGTEKKAPLYQYMASGFHYMFNHESERRPVRYPEKIIDSCLTLIDEGLSGRGKKLCSSCDFIDIDVVYTLTRSMRQTHHRFDEAREVLDVFADRYLAMMYAIDPKTNERFDDLHCLFGSVCCLAELQSALPGKMITTRPLKLVLDRRPFI